MRASEFITEDLKKRFSKIKTPGDGKWEYMTKPGSSEMSGYVDDLGRTFNPGIGSGSSKNMTKQELRDLNMLLPDEYSANWNKPSMEIDTVPMPKPTTPRIRDRMPKGADPSTMRELQRGNPTPWVPSDVWEKYRT